MAKVKSSEPKPFSEKLADKITMPVEDDPWAIKQVVAFVKIIGSIGGSKFCSKA